MIKRTVLFSAIFLYASTASFAYTTEHHAVNMSRALANMVAAPVKAVFISGPKAIKEMYTYEVHEREKEEKRAQLRHKLYAIISAPAVETKAAIDGVVNTVTYAGKFFKEFLSIPFCD
ncbi:MAG: hypothetical protein MUC52_01345 [Candidatus Omnitrophica bacterium]|jgi:hypothetical protein|nr:hypothetical protein [Candidatus Omnitrophota bacterium]